MSNGPMTANRTGATRGLWLAAMAFGAVSNLLLLTGPMFMLQVYDRVLPSRSAPTLFVLFALVAFLFAMMAGIDTARAQVMARIGARLRDDLEPQVIEASLRLRLRDPPDARSTVALRDLDTVHRVLAAPVTQAVLDVPWTLGFLALLWFVHPLLGWLAVAGGGVLALLALSGSLQQRHPSAAAQVHAGAADALLSAIDDEGADRAASLSPFVIARWRDQRALALVAQLRLADRSVRSTTLARTFRLFLQSATLALGAWLVLRGELSPGLMVGASILLGRALAPVEQLAAHWGQLAAAWAAWHRLVQRLRGAGSPPAWLTAEGRGALQLRGTLVASPGRGAPLLRLDGFDVAPGQALGVIGPGGAGKSLLARVLTGVVTPHAGTIRLGDTPLIRLPPMAIGYLPQRVTLLPGTIAEAIARHDPMADPARVEAAARLVGAHAGIVALTEGYATRIQPDCVPLPGGLVQRIGLARAVFGTPGLVILDEPNAHLDAEGSAALNAAIRVLKERGVVVVVTANRPVAISECDMLLVLDGGRQTGFGPRDQVLRDLVRNHMAVVRAADGGGG